MLASDLAEKLQKGCMCMNSATVSINNVLKQPLQCKNEGNIHE